MFPYPFFRSPYYNYPNNSYLRHYNPYYNNVPTPISVSNSNDNVYDTSNESVR